MNKTDTLEKRCISIVVCRRSLGRHDIEENRINILEIGNFTPSSRQNGSSKGSQQ